MDTQGFLRELTNSRHYRDQVIHAETVPSREPRHADPAQPIAQPVAEALRKMGIERLYTHQAHALDAIRRGENVVVVTGTASGKTLCYNIPVMEALLEDPAARALYLFPTKALAQDQLQGFRRLSGSVAGLNAPAGCYDGDTPSSERRTMRDKGRVILTNPDMLHSGILPNHSRWAECMENLRYVVIDEVHAYRGLFGANVANVVRRLRRICRHYGADPQFIFCSATIGNPSELCENLSGLPITQVDDDGSPRGEKSFLLWNPPHLDDAKVERRSPNTEAQYLLTDLIRSSCQTICFVRARVTAELVYRMVQDRLRKEGSRLANSIRAYRGGYVAEDRREIERQLFSGELMGVATTNALELGIDIGSMEACLLVGYPGTIASLWQQAGRAGRGTERALAVLIAQNEPIDQFLMRNPEFIFGRSPEHAVVDALNPHIQALHLRCAAKELPVSSLDEEHYGEFLYAILELLEERGDLRRRGDRWFWAKPNVYPAGEFSLRLGTDNVYQVIDVTGPEPNTIGQTDELSAYHQLHTQAIYLHQGETYFVRELNLERKHAYVEKGDFDYFTQSVAKAQIRVDEVEREAQWRVSETGVGDVTVTELVVMFRKIKFGSKDSIGFGNLELPPYPLETTAMWV
ncbi:MAG: DEAD/DEAH box helicase, partial [Armatimonadia bacterium]|nr:DEAD/DEAH box helicase [Armatimonadia bacterium]